MNARRCSVPRCRKGSAINYLGKGVCERHWNCQFMRQYYLRNVWRMTMDDELKSTSGEVIEVHKIGKEVGICCGDKHIFVTEDILSKLVEELLFQGKLEVSLTITRSK